MWYVTKLNVMQGGKIVEPAEQAQECWLVPQWAGRGWITVLNRTVRVASLRRRGFRRDLRVESEPGGPKKELSRQRPKQSRDLSEYASSVPGASQAEGKALGQEAGCEGGWESREQFARLWTEKWHDLTYVSVELFWLLLWEWLTWGQ